MSRGKCDAQFARDEHHDGLCHAATRGEILRMTGEGDPRLRNHAFLYGRRDHGVVVTCFYTVQSLIEQTNDIGCVTTIERSGNRWHGKRMMDDRESFEFSATRRTGLEQRSIDETVQLAGREIETRQLSAELGADTRRLSRGDDDPRPFSS